MSLRPDLSRLQSKLDQMPDRAVIVDQYGDAWQKSGHLGYWYRAFDGNGVDTWALVQHAVTARKPRHLSAILEDDAEVSGSGQPTPNRTEATS